MKKLDDFFASGVIIGSIGNIVVLTIVWVSLLVGMKIRTNPWDAMAELLFKPPEVYNFYAQLFGLITSFGVSITNGIITGGLLRFTGRDFTFLKSLVVCISTYILGLMIFPLLGFTVVQHSISTVYHGFFNNIQFAILTAYLFLRFTTVGLREPENETKEKLHAKFVPVPARKLEHKEKTARLVKP